MVKKKSKHAGGRPTLYPGKTWRPPVLCTADLKAIANGKAAALGCSISDVFERAVRELKVS